MSSLTAAPVVGQLTLAQPSAARTFPSHRALQAPSSTAEPRATIPGICTDKAYMFQGSNGKGQLYSFDLTTGRQTPIPNTDYGASITYSRVDGKVVGISPGTSKIVRYDPVHGGYTLAPLKKWPAGEVTNSAGGSSDGRLMYTYSQATSRLRTIDIDPGSPTYGTVLKTIAIKVKRGNIPDIAMHPADGFLYGIDTNGHLIRMSPTIRGSSDLGKIGPADPYGAAMMDDIGNLYVADNNTGVVYQINLTASAAGAPLPAARIPKARRIGRTQRVTGNDGAACLRPHDFGDAPNTYGTTKAAGGAEAIVDFDLTLGRRATAEQDANTPLDGTGDADDALRTPLRNVRSGSGYQLSVPVHNASGQPAAVAGWIDFNRNGRFDSDERVAATAPAGNHSVKLVWSAHPGAVAGKSFVRLRLYRGSVADPRPTGSFDNAGEVEDYPLTVRSTPAPTPAPAPGGLTIVKTVSAPTPVKSGDKVVYTVKVTNTGSAPYPAASFSDPLTGVLDDATYNNDARADTGTLTPGAPPVAWTGDLAPGRTATVTYSVTVKSPDPGDHSLTSTVTGPPGSDCAPGSTNARCTTTTPVETSPTPTPGLQIVKSASPAKPLPGQDVTYTIKVTNTGDTPYPNATVSDDLTGVLDDATYKNDAAADSGAVSYSASHVNWTGEVPVGGTVTITYSVKVDQPDSGDHALKGAVTGPADSNCGPGSTDPRCSTSVAAPLYDFGNAPASYHTTLADNGPRHLIVPGLALGSREVPVVDGKPGTSAGKEENGVRRVPTLYAGARDYRIQVGLTNRTGKPAVLAGWIDANHNGTFDPSEKAQVTVEPNATSATLHWTRLNGEKPGRTQLRLRLFGDSSLATRALATRALATRALAPISPVGYGGPGGVADYSVRVAPNPLTITKTASIAHPKPGDTVKYTITVNNSGTVPYEGATLTDDLTPLLDDARYNGDASATTGTVGYRKPELSWNGTVPAAGQAVITYSVTIGDPDSGDGDLTSAVVGPDGSNCEAGATDPSCSAKVNVANPGTGTAPASGGHPATPSGSLPKTGVGNNEWLLAESAAALLLAGGAMTAAKRRRRS